MDNKKAEKLGRKLIDVKNLGLSTYALYVLNSYTDINGKIVLDNITETDKDTLMKECPEIFKKGNKYGI